MSTARVDAPAPRMAGRRALITGGANGLGAATARCFAAEGCAIAIADLEAQRDAGEALAGELREMGVVALYEPVDVRDVASARGAVERADGALGGIDTVVASAGVGVHPEHRGAHGDLLHIDVEHFDFVLDINLRGVFVVLQRAAQLMTAAGRPGAMVTLASMASKRPTAGAYSVSKAAVWMLTRCLAQQLGPHAIRVNAIGPGYVETELFGRIVAAGAGPEPAAQAQFRATRRAQIALGEFPVADDIAQTALFLCSDAGRSFTGSILHPDGGYTSTFGGG